QVVSSCVLGLARDDFHRTDAFDFDDLARDIVGFLLPTNCDRRRFVLQRRREGVDALGPDDTLWRDVGVGCQPTDDMMALPLERSNSLVALVRGASSAGQSR